MKNGQDVVEVGSVIDADITNNIIEVKLAIAPGDAKIGILHVVEDDTNLFYCISVNVKHRFENVIMKIANTVNIKRPIKHGRDTSGSLERFQFPSVMHLSCLKVIRKDNGQSMGFKVIPRVFSKARIASIDDVDRMVEGVTHPNDTVGVIGNFLGTDCPIPLNLTELYRVPLGVFGKTGYGKTISMKMLIIRTVQDETYVDDRPVRFIIFDAHSEYARGVGSDGNLGLFQYVPDKLHQLSIDPNATIGALTTPLFIDPSKLNVSDWLNLFWDYTGNMETLLNEMEKSRRKDIKENGENDTNRDLALYADQFTDEFGAFPQYTVNAVWRRMKKFVEPYIRRFLTKPTGGHNHVMEELERLLNAGKSVIIHFGIHGADPGIYLFITNYIAREMYKKYILSAGNPDANLPHVVMVVEEAHRFVPEKKGDQKGDQFSTGYFDKIAREGRKVHLTAAFVDQRPSKLDEDVISQMGTRIIHRIDDPDDTRKALIGTQKSRWTPILHSLGRGEALVFGNAVGDIPTIMKPYWSNEIQKVKDFFGIKGVTMDHVKRKVKKDSTSPFEVSGDLTKDLTKFLEDRDEMSKVDANSGSRKPRVIDTLLSKKDDVKPPKNFKLRKKRDLGLDAHTDDIIESSDGEIDFD